MNIRKNTTRSNRHIPKKLIQLLIILHREGNMPGHNPTLLIIPRGIPRQLKDFGTEVLEDGSEVDGCPASDARSVFSLAEESPDTADGELEACFGAAADGSFLFAAASFAFSFAFSCPCCVCGDGNDVSEKGLEWSLLNDGLNHAAIRLIQLNSIQFNRPAHLRLSSSHSFAHKT